MLALFMFLDITPSIAVIRIFTQSASFESNNDALVVYRNSNLIINARKISFGF